MTYFFHKPKYVAIKYIIKTRFSGLEDSYWEKKEEKNRPMLEYLHSLFSVVVAQTFFLR